jgi:TolB protein
MVGDPGTLEVRELGEPVSCSDRATFPHWSRDGSRIAYYRGVYDQATGAGISSAVYVIDVATGAETLVTGEDVVAGDSDWAMGDEWLVFSTYPLNDYQCCEISNLYRINPDGTGLEQITHYEDDTIRATQPRFTPDGEWIVFTADLADSRELWVMPAEGGEPIVVRPGGIHTHGTWQPGM